MPCLTPCLLTTHDIYLTSRNRFCSALQAHETLQSALADRQGQPDPTEPQQPLGQRGFQSSRAHPAATFNLSSRAAAESPHLSSCDRGWCQLQARLCWPCTQSWASPLRPSRGCRPPRRSLPTADTIHHSARRHRDTWAAAAFPWWAWQAAVPHASYAVPVRSTFPCPALHLQQL